MTKSILLLFLLLGLSRAVSGIVQVPPVMVGGMVTLHTGAETYQQGDVKWYFNNSIIAIHNGESNKTCTDVQCNGGSERFKGRLKLDYQTGSLTIMDTRNTDAGEYQLEVIGIGINIAKIYNVSVNDLKKTSVKEEESVTSDTELTKSPDDEIIGLSPGAVVCICVVTVAIVIAPGIYCYFRVRATIRKVVLNILPVV